MNRATQLLSLVFYFVLFVIATLVGGWKWGVIVVLGTAGTFFTLGVLMFVVLRQTADGNSARVVGSARIADAAPHHPDRP